ncbi:RAI2 protein, partial [Anseranas semipalmata]|nr:RAI2 protein [Anseranas semipalmata]
MEELYKETPNLPVDVTSPPAAMANNKLENGVAQLITAEAWNINSADLMKKALSPLVTVPAPSILTPPAESQSGVALKVAATVLQPICLGDSPVVLPIHLQVAGSAAPQMPAGNATPYVMTTQGPVPLPVLLEQHVFQHLNSPLVLPPGAACPASPLHGGLFPGASAPVGQPQLLDPKPAGPGQEPVLPPVFQTPGFAAVLQDLFPSGQGALGSAPCQPPPDYAALPPQAFSSPLSPLPAGRAACEPKAGGNNIEIVSTSQTAKVIVSVKDAVPTIFCGKIKGLSGVSTKNFSFKRDMPQDSVLQCYDVKSQPEPRDNAEALRKPVKNRSVKLKKMNSPEIHILPIKKQRLAAFFPRK